jgi:hypothetical protein
VDTLFPAEIGRKSVQKYPHGDSGVMMEHGSLNQYALTIITSSISE